jgi:hypothetical protein
MPNATGAIDPYWHLINVAPPSVNGNNGISIPSAYTVQSGNVIIGFPWLGLYPNAVALSVIANPYFGTNNTVPNQPWRFVRQFYLCQPDSVHFVVDHIGDDLDTVNIFDSNGVSVFSNSGAGWHTIQHFDVTRDMAAGCSYMTVELVNTGHGNMGFAVNASLTANQNSLSNPSTACCNGSMISGQKIIDSNCNGQVDTGEQPGAGWTITLSGSSGNQTATTDANGEFTFYNVANGTYTLQEATQTGFTPTNPASGQFTVIVNAANSAQTFQFLNCPQPPPPPCQCEGRATVDQGPVTVTAQNNTSNANPISTATTSFTLTASAPVSEVRMLIDESRLTPTSGNENCILCRNKPQAWANINAGSLAGVANQITANPSTLERDIRELVFNNGAGTVFNLNGNTLNLTLGVPGVTGLACCTLKAEVCVKFIIRDVNCCEREIEKCLAFNL